MLPHSPVRSSRLALTCGDVCFPAGYPQVKRVQPTWRLPVPAGVVLCDGEAEFLEFGDELAQAAVVVEPGAVVGELVVGQDAG